MKNIFEKISKSCETVTPVSQWVLIHHFILNFPSLRFILSHLDLGFCIIVNTFLWHGRVSYPHNAPFYLSRMLCFFSPALSLTLCFLPLSLFTLHSLLLKLPNFLVA